MKLTWDEGMRRHPFRLSAVVQDRFLIVQIVLIIRDDETLVIEPDPFRFDYFRNLLGLDFVVDVDAVFLGAVSLFFTCHFSS